MYSSYISSPMSTISVLRVNTPLKGGWRWSAVPRCLPVAAESSTVKSSMCTEVSAHMLLGSICPLDAFPFGLFFFYTYLGHLYILMLFWCFNGVTSAGLDCIRDCVFGIFTQTLKPLFTGAILYCFITLSILCFWFGRIVFTAEI